MNSEKVNEPLKGTAVIPNDRDTFKIPFIQIKDYSAIEKTNPLGYIQLNKFVCLYI